MRRRLIDPEIVGVEVIDPDNVQYTLKLEAK
jgi:hypothetical protein